MKRCSLGGRRFSLFSYGLLYQSPLPPIFFSFFVFFIINLEQITRASAAAAASKSDENKYFSGIYVCGCDTMSKEPRTYFKRRGMWARPGEGAIR